LLHNIQNLILFPNRFSYKKVKVKVNLVHGHEGTAGEYSSTLSLTSALDGGVWSTPRPGRFTPGKDPLPVVLEAIDLLIGSTNLKYVLLLLCYTSNFHTGCFQLLLHPCTDLFVVFELHYLTHAYKNTATFRAAI
jgi:hypothetical protein